MTVTVPTLLADALVVLDDHPARVVLAGGTDVMVQVNEGARRPGPVLAVAALAVLREVRREGDELFIGAGVTYTELMGDTVAPLVPALAQAARTVGSPQIRNAATIGGNLGTASPAGDALPVLIALGATLDVASSTARRAVSIAEFFTGPKRSVLAPGELVVAVRVPVRRGPQDYLKVGVRNAMVIAVASLAIVVDLDARSIGIGLGSVGPTPLGASDACEWTADRASWRDDGLTVAPDDAVGFGARVAAAARPIDDHRGTAEYRR